MRAVACGIMAIYFLKLAQCAKIENQEFRGLSVVASWFAIGFAFVATIIGI